MSLDEGVKFMLENKIRAKAPAEHFVSQNMGIEISNQDRTTFENLVVPKPIQDPAAREPKNHGHEENNTNIDRTNNTKQFLDAPDEPPGKFIPS